MQTLPFSIALLAALALLLAPCGAAVAATNIFGMGLTNSGGQSWQQQEGEVSLTANLAGPGGKILLLFVGLQRGVNTPDGQWVAGLSAALRSGLHPVVRLNPPWGQSNIRDQSDDANHLNYTSLAKSYASVVASVMTSVESLAPEVPVLFQIGNEFNLCDEWTCSGGANLLMQQTAIEVAHFTKDVMLALKGLGNPRVRVGVAPMAPGGTVECNCCGAGGGCQWQGGATGLQFMAAMLSAVPDLYQTADFLASHSYPAQGVGWGFFCPFVQAATGLLYYQLELKAINLPNIPVYLTETGWTTQQGCKPSLQDEATYMVAAYALWLNETAHGRGHLHGVMPFQLMDASWQTQGFYWVDTNGGNTPQYTAVQQLRCQTVGGC